MLNSQSILVEIRTEELPPKALQHLSNAFVEAICNGLKAVRLPFGEVQPFASPRRLAVMIKQVQTQQEPKIETRKGPALQAAFDQEGKPTKAVEGFARSCGVTVDELDHLETDKGTWLVFNRQVKGKAIHSLLPDIVHQSLVKLPTPKRMRWGSSDIEFVRPIHSIIILVGNEMINTNLLGIKTSNITRGHRFHASGDLVITSPESYEKQLYSSYVMASFEARRQRVKNEAEKAAIKLGGQVVIAPELLDEVTALVEWPVAIAGDFEKQFLKVPQECLITTMEDHQKYFAVLDHNGAIMPHFITTSNIESNDIIKVKEGNERVIRPRFADAEFFWEHDKQHSLYSRRNKTKKIIFQKQLGSIFDKTERVALLAKHIAKHLKANEEEAIRAAELSKCDLMTDMVIEFTKLQGVMGRYYALNDGEVESVAQAIEEQYKPAYAGDTIPKSTTGQIVSIADKIDTIIGIFAIGMKPTGTKDPFALRRASLGVLRIIIEADLDLDLNALLTQAASHYAADIKASEVIDDTFFYMMERLKSYYQDQGVALNIIDAVASVRPSQPLDFAQRIKAVMAFSLLPEAQSLAASNKRIGNILKKYSNDIPIINEQLLQELAEKNLYEAVIKQDKRVTSLFSEGRYEEALTSLAGLKDTVDNFFDEVMVMVDDEALKGNRLALLNDLRSLFLHVGDLSRL